MGQEIQGAVLKIIGLLDEKAQAVPIEGKETITLFKEHDFIILAYPIQFSNMPVMVRYFIKNNSELWQNKKVLSIATKVLFSENGAGKYIFFWIFIEHFNSQIITLKF